MRRVAWLGIAGWGCRPPIVDETAPVLPGGAELWSAAGATGARPIVLAAEGDARCGWSGSAPAGDVIEVDGDGVVDLALHCAGTDPRQSTAPTPITGTLPDSEELRVWSGADALAGRVVERVRRPVVSQAWVVTVPDLDGDGVDELSTRPNGAPPGSAEGWARIVRGGDPTGPGWSIGGDSLWYPLVPTGLAVGDYDADGVSDLVVAAWPSSSTDDGRVYVVSGASVPGQPGVDDAPLRAWTAPPGALGRLERVTPVGDLDGDGLTDLVVTTVEGEVRVLFAASGGGAVTGGPAIATLDPGKGGDIAVIGLGDLDADGHDELVISALRFRSSEDADVQIAVVPGGVVPASGTLALDDYIVETRPGAYEDAVLACDVDGDGASDLLTDEGWYSGAALLGAPARTDWPSADGGRVAGGVCAGDMDGDGRQDVMLPTLYPRP